METNRNHGDEKDPGKVWSISSVFAWAGLIMALIAALTAAGSGLGSSWEWWTFRRGFTILRWGTYLGIASAVVCVVGCVMTLLKSSKLPFVISLVGLLLGSFIVALPMSWWMTVSRVPAIHDISTDTDDPPQFVSILPLRMNAANPASYGGPEIAGLQHQFYPDIRPVMLAVTPSEAFSQALRAAKAMKWQIVDVNQSQGRIEATATTTWFRFKDDIVIRIRGTGGQSRLDIRSVSRVGKSDVGTNARRIRAFVRELMEK